MTSFEPGTAHAPTPPTSTTPASSWSTWARCEMNHVVGGRPDGTGAAARPGPDRVVVGLRGRDAPPRRALLGLRRRPPGPGPQHPDPRPLHARPHRRRPGAVHRPGDRPADHRERAVLRRRAVGLAVRLRQARPGRSPPSTRTRRCSPPRSARPSAPASARASARCSTCGAPTSATSGRSAHGTPCARAPPSFLPEHLRFIPVPGGAAAEPARSTTPSGVGPSGPARSRPRATTSGCCAASKVPDVLLTHHMRVVDDADRLPARGHDRPAGPAGPGPAHRGRGRRDLPLVPGLRPLDARRPARALRRDAARVGRGPRTVTGLIDVHAHHLPEVYREALRAPRPRPARRLPPHPGVVGRRARGGRWTGWGSPRRCCRSRRPACTSATSAAPTWPGR